MGLPRIPSVLLLLASVLDGSGDPQTASDTVARLHGVWSFERVEVEGVTQPPVDPTHKLVIARDGRYTIVQGPRITRGRLTLDPAATPKHYDTEVTEGPGKGRTNAGIYDLASDSYRVCLSLRNGERPTDFTTRPGSGRLLFVFKRQASDILPALVAIARQELTGTWQADSHALDGQTATAEDLKRIRLEIDGDGLATALRDDAAFIAGTTVIDPTRQPMTIDISYTVGELKGLTAPGIYRIEDGLLTMCRAAPGQARPPAFASEPGSGRTLMTYRRVTPALPR